LPYVAVDASGDTRVGDKVESVPRAAAYKSRTTTTKPAEAFPPMKTPSMLPDLWLTRDAWKSRLRPVRRSVNRLIPSCFARSHRLTTCAELNPVFIVGSGRSGNTLLRRLICKNDQIFIPPETFVLLSCINIFKDYAHMPWPLLCRLILSQFIMSLDFDTFPRQDLRELDKKLQTLPPRKRSLATILHMFYMFQASEVKPKAERWGDKTPVNAFCLNELHQVFPNALFIHIVRNGYDVVNSYLKMGRYKNAEDAAERWARAINACQHFYNKHPNMMITIKYEDIITNNEYVMQEIGDFLSLDLSPDVLKKSDDVESLGDITKKPQYAGVAQPISIESIGKGVREMPEDDIRRIEGIVEKKNRELGYICDRRK
jgi:hypothetical protein